MSNYLTQEEKDKISLDWKYKGYSIIDLLTEEEVDIINQTLDVLRINRNSK